MSPFTLGLFRKIKHRAFTPPMQYIEIFLEEHCPNVFVWISHFKVKLKKFKNLKEIILKRFKKG
jgi:hypothetical protein